MRSHKLQLPSRRVQVALLACGLVAGLLAYGAAVAQGKTAPAAPQAPAFDSFKILVERNIFDPTRKSTAQQAKEKAPAPPPVETVRLMGTYLRGDQTLALFEGGSAAPAGAVARGESIAGYRLDKIRTDAVVLADDKATLELPVGGGLSKGADGHWTVVDKPVIDKPAAPPAADGTAKPEAASGSGEKTEDDAVKKMRERRKKELGS